MPIKRFHLLSVIILLASVAIFKGCGDADDSYEGDPIESWVEKDRSRKSVDVTAPVLTEVKAVTARTNDTTPRYTFRSSELGMISYGRSCSSDSSVAISGENLISFNTLTEGTHSNCMIRVKDVAGNQGSLKATSFIVDTTAPILRELVAIPSRTKNKTPLYKFSSTEEGTSSYMGGCSSDNTTVLLGTNTVAFQSLKDGSYGGCSIKVTDRAGNQGSLSLSAFSVDATAPTVISVIPSSTKTSVSIDTPISLTFSEAMNLSSINVTDNAICSGSLQLSADGFSTCVPMSSTPSVSNGGQTFTVKPSASLSGETAYSIRISTDVKDHYGNSLTLKETGFTTEDTTPPILSEKTAIAVIGSDTTPSFTFTSNEVGTITYSGSCSSSETSAEIGDNLITFNTLSEGTYNCSVSVKDSDGNKGFLNLSSFTIDTSAPTVHSTSPLNNDSVVSVSSSITIFFSEEMDPSTVTTNTANTSCSGSIQVSSDSFTSCVRMASKSAYASNQAFTVKPHSNLDGDTIYKIGVTAAVKDRAGNFLDQDGFTSGNQVYQMGNGFTTADTLAPVLTQTVPVKSLTNDTTPSYIFSSSEAGTISYTGSCSSSKTSASAGSNTVTFNSLSEGIYINCAITVTDASGNRGFLNVSPFIVDTTDPTVSSYSPADSQTDISLGTHVEVTFSETMDLLTVTTNTTNTDCSGSIQLSSDGFSSCIRMEASPVSSNFFRTYKITPRDNLLGQTTYKIKVTMEAKDLAGNSLASALTTTNGFTTADVQAPIIAEVTKVPTPSNDSTPSYVFSSNEAGEIIYSGSCSSSTTSASVGNNNVTFSTLSAGTYSDCVISVKDTSANESAKLYVNTFIVDDNPPVVDTIIPPNNTTGVSVNTSLTLKFSESMDNATLTVNTTGTSCSGSIQLSSDSFSSCVKMSAQPSVSDSDRIYVVTPFTSLSGETVYKIKVTTLAKDAAGIAMGSDYETSTGFSTEDIIAPVLSEVTAVPTPGRDSTPDYTFSTNEAGTLTYSGSCSSLDNNTAISTGSRTVTFTALADGTYSDCIVSVKDSSSNIGSLSLSLFRIDLTQPSMTSISPADGATAVSVNSAIRISFSEAMDNSSVTVNTSDTTCSRSIQVSSDNFTSCIEMASSPSASASSRIFEVTPATSLTGETTYLTRVTTSVKDKVGNPMETDNVTSSGFTAEDNTPPELSISTGVTSPTNDQTPNFSFNSSEAGTLSVTGSCSTSVMSVSSGTNLITFGTLTEGTYGDCEIRVTDAAGNVGRLNVNTFTVDVTRPAVYEATPVSTPTNDTTPTYVFSTNESGTISFKVGDSCSTSETDATEGPPNTVELNTLSQGTYSCTLIVTDLAGNEGQVAMSTFIVDTTAPTLAEVTPVSTPGNDSTPDYIFSSNEAGLISYSGSCNSSDNSTMAANKTVTFSSLGSGTYSSCKVMVTDAAGNKGILNVSTFTIDVTSPTVASTNPADSEITISVSTKIAVTFSEPMQTSSITTSSSNTGCSGIIIQLSSDNFANCIRMIGAPTPSNSNKTFTVEPSSNLSSETTYKIHVSGDAKDTLGNPMISTYTTSNGFTTADVSSPELREITKVSTPSNVTTPTYVFYSSETGTISYSGSCSSSTTSASAGSNTITFNALADGTYSDCTLTVRDSANNEASLSITSFTIDATKPVLLLVTPVPTPRNNLTPEFIFHSNEAGDIDYEGDCSSATTSASSNNNPIIFDTLSAGTHSNCKIRVTDAVGNVSDTLAVNSFTIDITKPEITRPLNPVDNSTGVAMNTAISVVFTKPMNPSTATANTNNTCSGSLQLSSDNFNSCIQMEASPAALSNSNKTLTIKPKDNLTGSKLYQLRVTTDLKDLAGNSLEDNLTSSGFTTVWGTIQIGTPNEDQVYGIASGPSDEFYVAGKTIGGTLNNKTSNGAFDGYIIKFNKYGVQEWTDLIGNSGNDTASDVVVDNSSGSIYVTGTVRGALDDSNTSFGSDDIFLIKYNPDKTREWAYQFGGTGNDHGFGLALDLLGNVYVTGRTKSTLKPPCSDSNSGNYDIFVLKYDHNNTSGVPDLCFLYGNISWDEAKAIDVDSSGNIYVTGHTMGYINLGLPYLPLSDPWVVQSGASGTSGNTFISFSGDVTNQFARNTPVKIETDNGTQYGYVDNSTYSSPNTTVYLMTNKHGPWTKRFLRGSTGPLGNNFMVYPGNQTANFTSNLRLKIRIYSEARDPRFVYQYGYVDHSTFNDNTTIYLKNLDGTPLVLTHPNNNATLNYVWYYNPIKLNGNLLSSSYSELDDWSPFLVKFDSSGSLEWERIFGSTSFDQAYSVKVDSSDNIFVAGATKGILDDQSTLSRLPGHVNSDAFIRKYNPTGNPDEIWTWQTKTGHNMEVGAADDARDMIIDHSNGAIYLVGNGAAMYGQTGEGGYDWSLFKFNYNGTSDPSLDWVRLYGSNNNDGYGKAGNAVTISPSGEILYGGISSKGVGGHSYLGGKYDVYVVKYNLNGVKQ